MSSASSYYFLIIGAGCAVIIVGWLIWRRHKLRQEQTENEVNNNNTMANTGNGGDFANTTNYDGRGAVPYNYGNDPSNHDVVYGQPQQYNSTTNNNAYGTGTYGAPPPPNIYGNNAQHNNFVKKKI